MKDEAISDFRSQISNIMVLGVQSEI